MEARCQHGTRLGNALSRGPEDIRLRELTDGEARLQEDPRRLSRLSGESSRCRYDPRTSIERALPELVQENQRASSRVPQGQRDLIQVEHEGGLDLVT